MSWWPITKFNILLYDWSNNRFFQTQTALSSAFSLFLNSSVSSVLLILAHILQGSTVFITTSLTIAENNKITLWLLGGWLGFLPHCLLLHTLILTVARIELLITTNHGSLRIFKNKKILNLQIFSSHMSKDLLYVCHLIFSIICVGIF